MDSRMIKTVFSNIDNKKTGYFKKGSLVILTGRPAMGKTSLALSISKNLSVRENKKVAIFSFSLEKEEIFYRLISKDTKLNIDKCKESNLYLKNDFKLPNITIAHGSSISLEEIKGNLTSKTLSILDVLRISKEIKKEGLDFVVIDSLDSVKVGDCFLLKDYRKLKNVLRNLKDLAKELDLTILITINGIFRKVEERVNKRPELKDLRYKTIENEADILMILYRDEVYDVKSKKPTELMFAKNNNGICKTIKLKWEKEFLSFS